MVEMFNYCRHAAWSIHQHGHQDALSDDGKFRSAREVVINGGTFAASGKDFLAIMEGCRQVMVEKPLRVFAGKWVSEETALVWVVYDGKWPAEPYSMLDFSFGPFSHTGPDPIFMHYIYNKPQMIEDFNRLFGGK